MPRPTSANASYNGKVPPLAPASFRASDPDSRRLVMEARLCLDDVQAQLTDLSARLADLRASVAVPSQFLRSAVRGLEGSVS